MAEPDPPVVCCKRVSHEHTQGKERSRLTPWRSTDSKPTVTALRNVSLEVRRGEIVRIAGPSGSGKSTLLHLIAGLTTPTAGNIEFLGTNIITHSERDRTRLRRQHIGIVFQRFHLLPSLSARANVALPLVERGLGKRTRREWATALLEKVGLEDRITHKPSELSGGEKQRVAIARALINEPDLLIADEPTGELDTQTGTRILEIFDELTADQAVIVASHDDSVDAVADRIIRLRDGELVGDG